MLDAHCHYFPYVSDDITVFYNSVIPDDWDKIPGQENIVPFYGIHPWFAETKYYDELDRLENIAKTAKKNGKIFGIGETGIDRNGRNPDIEVQYSFFLRHLNIAEELMVPVSVHCVHGWEILDTMLKSVSPDLSLLLHFYSGSWETAKRLLRRNTWFSFSLKGLEHSKKSLEALRKIPSERIFLETDSFEKDFTTLKIAKKILENEKSLSYKMLEEIEKNNLEKFLNLHL